MVYTISDASNSILNNSFKIQLAIDALLEKSRNIPEIKDLIEKDVKGYVSLLNQCLNARLKTKTDYLVMSANALFFKQVINSYVQENQGFFENAQKDYYSMEIIAKTVKDSYNNLDNIRSILSSF